MPALAVGQLVLAGSQVGGHSVVGGRLARVDLQGEWRILVVTNMADAIS